MNIIEEIKKHPAVWFLGAMIGAFLAGISSYEFFLKVTQLDTVQKNAYVLKEEIKKKYIDKKACDELKNAYEKLKKSNSAVILKPTWLIKNTSLPILSGQITIRIEEIDGNFDRVLLQVDTQQIKVKKIVLKEGERRAFKFKNDEYIITLLDAKFPKYSFEDSGSAYITIAKRL